MSTNARNVIIAVVGFLILGAVVCTILHYGETAGERRNERQRQCIEAGGSFIDQPNELCLIGMEVGP